MTRKQHQRPKGWTPKEKRQCPECGAWHANAIYCSFVCRAKNTGKGTQHPYGCQCTGCRGKHPKGCTCDECKP